MNLEANRAEAEELLAALSQAKQEADAKLADIDKWASLVKEKSTSLEAGHSPNGEQGAQRPTSPHQDIRIFYKSVGLC